jgi:hypothetical protein
LAICGLALREVQMITYLLVVLVCQPTLDCRWRRVGHYPTHEICARAALPGLPFKCVMQTAR